MLVPIIFIITLLLALATATLESGLAAAKISSATSVARYSEVAVTDGVADFTTGLADYVRTHGTQGPWPTSLDLPAPEPLCGDATAPGTCPFAYTIAGTVTGASGGDAAPAAPDPAANLQTSVIAEQRVSVSVRATITSAGGAIVGTRTRLLTYRVFEAPPYAIVSGSRDASSIDDSRGSAPGDSGGAAPAPALADDTRIHVQLTCSTAIKNVVPLQNDQAVAGNDGLPWGNAAANAYEAPCHKTASPADAFADGDWKNGDTTSPGWSQ